MTLLKRVARIRVSNVDKKSYEGETPVRLCNYTDVYYGDSVRADEGEYMSATASAEQIRNFRLQSGDTVLTKDSETADDIGVSAYIAVSAPDFVCGYHLAVLRPDKHLIDPKFLFWTSRSSAFTNQLSVTATGVTRYGLRTDAIAGVDFEDPPLEEQRRIADFLDDQVARLDRVITLRRQQANLAVERFGTELEHALHGSAVGGTLPLRRLSKGIEQGSSPQCENRPAEEGEWGVVKLSSVRAGDFRPAENKALPVDIEPVQAYEICDGDLLVTRANTPALVGDIAVARDAPRRLQLCDLIYRVRLLPGVPADFVAASLLSSRNRSLISVVARGTSSSMAKLRGEDVLNLRVPKANAREQNEIAAMHVRSLEQRRSVSELLGRNLDLLQARKQALIDAAVTGKLDVTTARAVA